MCVLLEGILNSMNNTTEQKIPVDTIRRVYEEEKWAETKSLTWGDMSCFFKMQHGIVTNVDPVLEDSTTMDAEEDNSECPLDTNRDKDWEPSLMSVIE